MAEKISKWKRTHLEKYGGEEGLKAEMARRRYLNKTPSYFATIDKETLKEIRRKGGLRGRKNEGEEAS
jgi:hypothetical protein